MLIMILNKISAHRLKLNQQIQRNQHDSVNHNRQFTLTIQKTASLTGFHYTAIPAENSKNTWEWYIFNPLHAFYVPSH